MHLLLVEDDIRLARALTRLLVEDRHVVEHAPDGQTGIELAGAIEGLDAVILDIGLPDMSGLDVARAIRGEGIETSILMLTARDTVHDRVGGLDAGADDYVVKPYSAEQLDARIRAVLRRTAVGEDDDPVLTVGGLRIDGRARVATLDDEELELSPREFDLLAYLAASPGRVVTKKELLTEVWRLPYGGADKTVDVHLSWLRRKLGETASDPRFLITVRGVGVKLVDPRG
jgi:DNA-binding response OmpR family regulator